MAKKAKLTQSEYDQALDHIKSTDAFLDRGYSQLAYGQLRLLVLELLDRFEEEKSLFPIAKGLKRVRIDED